jgi:hypothetical protein
VPDEAVDLSDPEELLDLLTEPGAPNALRLLSWTGSADRIVTIAERRESALAGE